MVAKVVRSGWGRALGEGGGALRGVVMRTIATQRAQVMGVCR